MRSRSRGTREQGSGERARDVTGNAPKTHRDGRDFDNRLDFPLVPRIVRRRDNMRPLPRLLRISHIKVIQHLFHRKYLPLHSDEGRLASGSLTSLRSLKLISLAVPIIVNLVPPFTPSAPKRVESSSAASFPFVKPTIFWRDGSTPVWEQMVARKSKSLLPIQRVSQNKGDERKVNGVDGQFVGADFELVKLTAPAHFQLIELFFRLGRYVVGWEGYGGQDGGGLIMFLG